MTNRLYIEDIRMSRNSEAVLSVMMENTESITAVEFLLDIPQEFSINPVTAILSERGKGHSITARKMRDGRYKFVIVSSDNSPIPGIGGKLFTVRIKSDDTVTDDNTYPLTMSESIMAIGSGENVIESATGGNVIIKSMPDLHIVALDNSDPVAGNSLNVRWRVRNDGRGATEETQWTDYIWLVPNISAGTSMAGSKLLGKASNVSSLAPGEYYENSLNVNLEERISGKYDLVVTSDIGGINEIDFGPAGGTPPIPYNPDEEAYGFLKGRNFSSIRNLEEENESADVSDNFFYKRIDIAVPPLPDLQVPSVVAVIDNEGEEFLPTPLIIAGLSGSTTFYSGKKVKVEATIKNCGYAGIPETTVTNELYISSTPDLESGRAYKIDTQDIAIQLNPGETCTCELSGHIPYNWYGDTYFIVRVDVMDQVYELANIGNNVGSSDLIDTFLTPGADFEPRELSVPDMASVGSLIEVGYSVRNIGPGIPFSNTWTDKVYLSTNDSGLDDSSREISAIWNQGHYRVVNEKGMGQVIPPSESRRQPRNVLPGEKEFEYYGDNYSNKRIIPLPILPEGDYYIYVVVDANDDVYEYDGEDNNILRSGKISIQSPDLVSELISVSDDSVATGSNLAVTWKVKNIGTTNIRNVDLNDGLYASSTQDKDDPEKIGSFFNKLQLEPGAEKILRANIDIPQSIRLDGDLYLFVKTNENCSVFESNTANNTSNVLPVKFKYIENPKPEDMTFAGYNLTLYDAVVPERSAPGTTLPVAFSIKNTGDKNIDHKISLNVGVSRDVNMNGSAACSAADFPTDNIILGPGESKTYDVTISLPENIQGGENYISIDINGGNSLSEKLMTDNKAVLPIYLEGNLADLSFENLIVPESVKTSQPFDISWEISNDGTWKSGRIMSTVYLSRDAVLSADDEKLDFVNTPSVNIGSTSTASKSIILNDSQFGNYYLLVSNEAVNSDEIRNDNNLLIKPLISIQAPLPDLITSDVMAEGKWKSGETAIVRAAVANIGDSVTRKDKWTDIFYLSEDYTFNPSNAIKIGSKTHVGAIAPEENYEILAEVKLPADVKGYYVLYVVTDGNDAIVEKGKANNKALTTVYIEDIYDSPAQLAIKKLSVPSRISAGEPFTISYTIENNGDFIAQGQLRDVYYLSKDSEWDRDDIMVGYASGDVEIDAGSEIIRSATGRLTNISEGEYYLIVRTNSTRNIPEVNYEDNDIVSTSSMNVDFKRLPIEGTENVQTSGLFKLDVTNDMQGKTLGLYLTQPEESSSGLYAAFESVPSTAKYDLSANDPDTDEQELLIPDVKEGTYYILAQDNSAVGKNLNEFVIDEQSELLNTVMSISAKEVKFGATRLAITEGGTNGRLSTDVQGALFDSIMDFRLVNGSRVIPAEAIIFKGQTSSKATFYLADAELGRYDLVSELPDGTQSVLPSYFTVVPSAKTDLGVKLDAPKATRISGYAPVSVTYVNNGQNDITISELLLTVKGGELSPTIEGFAADPQTEIHIKPNIESDKFGYVTIPPGKQETVNFYFRQTSAYTYLKLYIVK